MTLFESMQNYTIEEMAEFIYGLVSGTEERCIEQLHAHGIEASFVSLSPELRIADNVKMLEEEIDDT